MKIAIIGAGLAGLVAAYELRDHEVVVFDADERIGGKLRTIPFATGPVDVGAEAYLNVRDDATEFFRELGLGEKLVYPSEAGSRIYSQGELHPMPTNTLMGIPREATALGGLVDEATVERIASEHERPFEWVPGQDASIGDLVSQQFGDEVRDRVVSALLGGVYSCLAQDLSLRASVPQLAKALDELAGAGEPVTLTAAVTRAQHRPAPTAEQPKSRPIFASFAGGMAYLYDTLAEASGAEIYVDAFISGIARKGNKFTLTGGEGEFDRVIVATPAPTAAGLVRTVAPEVAPLLRKIQLASSAVVAMRFENLELPHYSGILVAADEDDLAAKAFTFSSEKWPHVAGTIVRASFGRFGDNTLVNAEDDALIDLAVRDLNKVLGTDVEPEEVFVQRWFGGLPRVAPGHNELVEEIEAKVAEIPGIELTGAWAHGVGIPAVIADARATAARAQAD